MRRFIDSGSYRPATHIPFSTEPRGRDYSPAAHAELPALIEVELYVERGHEGIRGALQVKGGADLPASLCRSRATTVSRNHP